MSEDRDLDSVVTVTTDGISVEKRYEPDQFAVPAIEFTIRSELDSSATVTLVDHVPESFPMDSVGFHPDYENDNWTAFKDHRVQFERSFEPGETVVTVYGIRITESDDVDGFLAEPELSNSATGPDDDEPLDPLEAALRESGGISGGPDLSDIVSQEGNQVLKDVLSGERDSLPGMGESDADGASAGSEPLDDPLGAVGGGPEGDSDHTEPSDPLSEAFTDTVDDDGEPSTDTLEDPLSSTEPEPEPSMADAASELDERESESADSEDEPAITDDEPLEELDDATPLVEEPADDEPSIEIDDPLEDEPSDAFDGDLVAAEPTLPSVDSIAGALADEIRQDAISDADLAILRQELDVTLPESTNVRIRHLQSRVEDLTAYTEALEEFIDDNGTAKQFVDEFETFEGDVEGLRDEVDDLEAEITEVQGLEDELQTVSDLELTVEAIQEGQSATSDRINELENEVRSFSEQYESLETDVQFVSEEIEQTSDQLRVLRTDVDALQELESDIEGMQSVLDDVSDLESKLDGVDEIRTDVSAVRVQLEELEELVGANTEDITNLSETLQNVEAELAGVTDVEGDLVSLDEQVDQLASTVDETEQSVSSAVESLESDVQTITEDIEEIRTWRDQLTSVFGPGDGN